MQSNIDASGVGVDDNEMVQCVCITEWVWWLAWINRKLDALAERRTGRAEEEAKRQLGVQNAVVSYPASHHHPSRPPPDTLYTKLYRCPATTRQTPRAQCPPPRSKLECQSSWRPSWSSGLGLRKGMRVSISYLINMGRKLYLALRTATWSCRTRNWCRRVRGGYLPIFESRTSRSASSGRLQVVAAMERQRVSKKEVQIIPPKTPLTIFDAMLIGSRRSQISESFSLAGCRRNSAVKLRTW